MCTECLWNFLSFTPHFRKLSTRRHNERIFPSFFVVVVVGVAVQGCCKDSPTKYNGNFFVLSNLVTRFYINCTSFAYFFSVLCPFFLLHNFKLQIAAISAGNEINGKCNAGCCCCSCSQIKFSLWALFAEFKYFKYSTISFL